MADFPKSANEDTLHVYNIPFESHQSAYLRTDISNSTIKEVDMLREIDLNAKMNDLKSVSKLYYSRYTPKL